MTDREFDLYVDHCYEKMERKQEKLNQVYNIGKYEEYYYNDESKKLEFKSLGNVMCEFEIMYIGTWAHTNNTWMWAWANPSFDDDIREKSKLIQELTEYTENKIFNMVGFSCDEVMAYEIVGMAMEYCNAIGMYRMPGVKSHVYVYVLLLNTCV